MSAIWRAIADDTAVALAAELTGVCDASLAMAMDYDLWCGPAAVLRETALVMALVFGSPGHLLVAPFRHTGDLETLEEPELLDIDRLLQRSVTVLRDEMYPHGFNVGMNFGGRAADMFACRPPCRISGCWISGMIASWLP